MFTGLFLILRAAIRSKTADDVVSTDLLALKIPQKCVDDVVGLLRSRSHFSLSFRTHQHQPENLTVDLHWS